MRETFPEGNFSIELPKNQCFRFESCDTYVEISGKDVKEVDFGWMETGAQTLWLMEFKDYDQEDAPDPDRDYLVENLSTKIRDVLTMLATSWAETSFGQQLRSDLRDTCPDFPGKACAIRPLVIVNLNRADASRLVGALTNEVNAELEGVLEMFGISRVTILTVGHPMIEDKLDICITQADQG